MSDWRAAVKEPGGCTLILFGFAALMIGYMVYWFLSGGSPENNKFRDDCYREQTRQYLPGDVPDREIERAVRVCERALRDKLGIN
jgi:hypothetical protein